MSLNFYNNSYVAIIGDIKKSKELDERKKVQLKLNDVLSTINEKYSTSIAAKFMITLGDEFQGLLFDGANALNIVEEIQMKMYPVQLRVGIGVGDITTNIDPKMAIGADGPGYYKARNAIEILKQNEQKNKAQVSDVRIEIDDDKYRFGIMLNTIFSLMTVIRSEWSQRQREIIWEYDTTRCSQTECAKKLNISQSNVQRGLAGGNYYAYKEAKESVNKILKEIGGKSV